MPLLKYPRFAYHAELAPDGLLVRTPADEPTGDGWVETPAAFDPKYVAPPDTVEPGSVPAEAAAAGYVPRPYPAHRYNRDGDFVVVRTAEDDAALDPAVWKATPDPKAFSDAPPPTTPPPVPGKALDDTQRAELYASSVTVVSDRIAALTDGPLLDAIRAAELANPKGPRIGVIRALDARREILDRVPA